MASVFTDELCPDLHTCRNGALCVESTAKEGAFACDCDSIADVTKSYAGVACEHEATVNCNEMNTKSYTSFCTNNGECQEMVTVNGKHAGCICPESYTGDFCEYLVGQVIPAHIDPDQNNTQSSSEGSNDKTIAALSVVLVLGIVTAIISFLFLQRMKRDKKAVESMSKAGTENTARSKQHRRDTHSPDLELEADGGVLAVALTEMKVMSNCQDGVAADVTPEPTRDSQNSSSNSDADDQDKSGVLT